MTKRIDQMYAWVTTDPGEDIEGVLGIQAGDMWLPLVGADMERAVSLKKFAALLGASQGQEVRLLRFTVRETCETIPPPDPGDPDKFARWGPPS